MSDLKLPVDPHYDALMSAVRRRIDDLRGDDGATVADVFFVREATNCVWGIVRLQDADSRLFLLHGLETMSLRKYSNGDACVNGDVGIDVNVVPWSAGLLPTMKMLAARDTAYIDHCACGHRLRDRTSITGMPIPACDGCGWVGCDPSMLAKTDEYGDTDELVDPPEDA